MSRSTSHRRPPGSSTRSAHSGGGSHGGEIDSGGGGGDGGGGPWVKVAFGRNQAEAELIQGLLLEVGIPSVLKRSIGFDVPDFLAAGPRDVLVASDLATKAREALADTTIEESGESEREELDEQVRLRSGGAEPSPERLAIWIGVVLLGGVIVGWLLYQLT